eukprot:357803-Chlamydomonas_euryale.AAC.2
MPVTPMHQTLGSFASLLHLLCSATLAPSGHLGYWHSLTGRQYSGAVAGPHQHRTEAGSHLGQHVPTLVLTMAASIVLRANVSAWSPVLSVVSTRGIGHASDTTPHSGPVTAIRRRDARSTRSDDASGTHSNARSCAASPRSSIDTAAGGDGGVGGGGGDGGGDGGAGPGGDGGSGHASRGCSAAWMTSSPPASVNSSRLSPQPSPSSDANALTVSLRQGTAHPRGAGVGAGSKR